MVNDQLDAQFFFLIYLFQFSTCFEQHSAHHQENKLYQYNVWYMSICVSDRLVCRSGRNFPTCIPRGFEHKTYSWKKWEIVVEACASNEIRQLWCCRYLISNFDMNFSAPHRKTLGISPTVRLIMKLYIT
jgi:hypothetical protein